MVFRNPRALACSILSAARVLATKGPRISHYHGSLWTRYPTYLEHYIISTINKTFHVDFIVRLL